MGTGMGLVLDEFEPAVSLSDPARTDPTLGLHASQSMLRPFN